MADFDKPSNTEEDFFAREDIEKMRKLALQQAADLETKRKDELKALHFMKCPKCGMDLHTLNHGKVEIDTCFNCKGVWLDAGELDQLVGPKNDSGAVMRAVLGIFKK